MTRHTMPPIRPSDLRDHADKPRIERVWDRIERDLPPGREPMPSRATGYLFALAAATAVAFSAGIWVGGLHHDDRDATIIRPVTPESGGASDVLAAGVASSGIADAGPERAPLPTARADDMDSRPRAPSPLSLPQAIAPMPLSTETPSVPVPTPGERSLSLDLLRQQPGGIDGAINSARTDAELLEISTIARAKGGDLSVAVKALTRLIERFPGGPSEQIACYNLGTLYEKMGQADQAQKYFARAQNLQGGVAEDALCKQIGTEARAGRKDEVSRLGKEYVTKYPAGPCKEEVERILSGEESAREEPPAVEESSPDAGDAAAP
jgi:hypothetical protein